MSRFRQYSDAEVELIETNKRILLTEITAFNKLSEAECWRISISDGGQDLHYPEFMTLRASTTALPTCINLLNSAAVRLHLKDWLRELRR